MTTRERYEKEQFLEAVLLEVASQTLRELGNIEQEKKYEVFFFSSLHRKNIVYQIHIISGRRFIVLDGLIACELCFYYKPASFYEEELLRFLRGKKISTGFIINFKSRNRENQVIKIINQKEPQL